MHGRGGSQKTYSSWMCHALGKDQRNSKKWKVMNAKTQFTIIVF